MSNFQPILAENTDSANTKTENRRRIFTLKALRLTLLILIAASFCIYLETYSNVNWLEVMIKVISHDSGSSEWTTTDLQLSCPARNLSSLPGLCLTNKCEPGHQRRCLMSITTSGRLGNLMGQYAALYALSRWNSRPAFMEPDMARVLRANFRVTMPTLSPDAYTCLKSNWTHKWIHDWMTDDYRSLDVASEQPLMLTGYPCSWTFFHLVRGEIAREFRLHDSIEHVARTKLAALLGNRTAAIFVGVHVRRGDYVSLMAGVYRGVVADADFFVRATGYFRSRYADVIFVVASDDMAWCRENIDNSSGDVYFAGSGNTGTPIEDFALLTQCNHSIITIGTFGFWSAYLAGGETVYLTNYTLPDSPWLSVFRYEAAYLPSWVPIAANLSVWLKT